MNCDNLGKVHGDGPSRATGRRGGGEDEPGYDLDRTHPHLGLRLGHGDALDRGGRGDWFWSLAGPGRGRHRAARIAALAFGCAAARSGSVGPVRAVRPAEPLGADPRASLLSSRRDPGLAAVHCGAGRDHGGAVWQARVLSFAGALADGMERFPDCPSGWSARAGRLVGGVPHRERTGGRARYRSPSGPICSASGSKPPASCWSLRALQSERPGAAPIAGGFAAFGLAMCAKQHFLGGPLVATLLLLRAAWRGRASARLPGLGVLTAAAIVAVVYVVEELATGGGCRRRSSSPRWRRRGCIRPTGCAGRSCWRTSAVEARV